MLNKSSRILYVHGSPGIGKSTIVKHVLEQFEDSNEKRGKGVKIYDREAYERRKHRAEMEVQASALRFFKY